MARAVVVGDVAPAFLGETIWNADHQAMSSVWRDGDEVGGYYESHMKLPPRAKYGSQAIGSARLAASHAAVNGQRAGREALPARAEAHDLEAKMMEACLPRRYFLKLVEMGFDSVEQLLYLGRLGRPLVDVLNALNIAPGHRVHVDTWLKREAAAADVAVRSEMSLLRKEAKLGKEAGERIRRAEEKRKRRELELAEALRREEELRRLNELQRQQLEARAVVKRQQGDTTARDKRMARYMRWLKAREVARAWVAWADNAHERKKYLAHVQKSLRRMRRAREVQVLMRWANRAKELGAYRRQLKKGLGKWQNRDAAQAFNGWAVFAALRRRRKRLLARGAKGMTPLGRAFNSWAHKSRGMRQRRDSLRKGIARMTDPQAKAFDTWKLMAHARRDAIAVLRRGGAALRSPELRWGFKVWRVAAFVAKRDEAARRRGGMGLAQPELLWAFNRFRAHRDAQRSFLKHNPFLKRAFNGWSSYAAEGRRQKGLLLRAASHLGVGPAAGMAAAIVKWYDATEPLRKARHFLLKMANYLVAKVFAAWVGAAHGRLGALQWKKARRALWIVRVMRRLDYAAHHMSSRPEMARALSGKLDAQLEAKHHHDHLESVHAESVETIARGKSRKGKARAAGDSGAGIGGGPSGGDAPAEASTSVLDDGEEYRVVHQRPGAPALHSRASAEAVDAYRRQREEEEEEVNWNRPYAAAGAGVGLPALPDPRAAAQSTFVAGCTAVSTEPQAREPQRETWSRKPGGFAGRSSARVVPYEPGVRRE